MASTFHRLQTFLGSARFTDLLLEKELRSHDVGQNNSGTSQTINRETREHLEQL